MSWGLPEKQDRQLVRTRRREKKPKVSEEKGRKRPLLSEEVLCDIIEHVPERRADAVADLMAIPLRTGEPLGVKSCTTLIKHSPPNRWLIAPLLLSLVADKPEDLDCIFDIVADPALSRLAGRKILDMATQHGHRRYVKVIENVLDLREEALAALLHEGARDVVDLNAIWRYAQRNPSLREEAWVKFIAHCDESRPSSFAFGRVLIEGIEDLPERAWPEYVKRDPRSEDLQQRLSLFQFQDRIWDELARRGFDKGTDLVKIMCEHVQLRQRAWAALVELISRERPRYGLCNMANGLITNIPSWLQDMAAREILDNNPSRHELGSLMIVYRYRTEAADILLKGDYVLDR